MPEAWASLLATPGLGWLVGAAVVAGVVRGFSGFGTAMVFLPVAGRLVSPFEALTLMIVMDVIGPLPAVPRALRDGHPGDVLRLVAGMCVALPIGVYSLSLVAPEVFRYGVSLVALTLLILLVAGVRYTRTLTRPMIYGTGGIGGLMAGAVGMAGPPVIMLYMAAPHPPQVIRANTMLYLILADFVMLAVLGLLGHLVFSAIALGLLLALPYLLGNVVGGKIFRPSAERGYRVVAYGIIALSAISGLPFLD